MINGLRRRLFESVGFTFIPFSIGITFAFVGFKTKANRLVIKLKGGNIINISMKMLFDVLIPKEDINIF